MFNRYGLSYKLVVEPQEREIYEIAHGAHDLIVMPKQGYGSASVVRNFIKDHARDQGHLYHWQIDDDMIRFMDNVNGKWRKANPAVVLSKTEALIPQIDGIVGGLTLCHTNNNRYPREYIVNYNKGLTMAFLIRNDNDIRFRGTLVEDTDYALQLLSQGIQCVQTGQLSLAALPQGRAAGGYKEQYDTEYDESREYLCALWPDIVKKRSGGGIHINWRKALKRS